MLASKQLEGDGDECIFDILDMLHMQADCTTPMFRCWTEFRMEEVLDMLVAFVDEMDERDKKGADMQIRVSAACTTCWTTDSTH